MPRATDVKKTIAGTLTGLKTDKAIQMRVSSVSGIALDEEALHWFPLSQVDKIFRNKLVGKDDEMAVSEWILQQKELI